MGLRMTRILDIGRGWGSDLVSRVCFHSMGARQVNITIAYSRNPYPPFFQLSTFGTQPRRNNGAARASIPH